MKRYKIPDVVGDSLIFETVDGVRGEKRLAVAELYCESPWGPNAAQLQTLRDHCTAALAEVDPSFHNPEQLLAEVRGAFTAAGYMVDTYERLMRAITALIGNNDLASLLDEEDAASAYHNAVERVAQSRALEDAIENLGDGLVADRAGNICTLHGKVIATGDPDDHVWRERIVAIVNAVGDAYIEVEDKT